MRALGTTMTLLATVVAIAAAQDDSADTRRSSVDLIGGFLYNGLTTNYWVDRGHRGALVGAGLTLRAVGPLAVRVEGRIVSKGGVVPGRLQDSPAPTSRPTGPRFQVVLHTLDVPLLVRARAGSGGHLFLEGGGYGATRFLCSYDRLATGESLGCDGAFPRFDMGVAAGVGLSAGRLTVTTRGGRSLRDFGKTHNMSGNRAWTVEATVSYRIAVTR